ncbi:oxygenase MpaB family protein [Lolliginicoccus levis]|uniref:oxygenase MpaB family protein n=1 Tax=Lolliginicoccus levis TaxID=2919542 RepID=UPI00241F66AF|nr:oxygenase MpaB family protein [Lolliginicoccus levis]
MNIPIRHPDRPRPVPGLTPVALLLGVGKPSPQQWDELGSGLLRGDPMMDELVEWMASEGKGTRPLFEQALRSGIDTIPDAPEPLRAFFAHYETPPPWLDRDKLRLGEKVLQRGGLDGFYLARDVSLMGGYLASGFNQTLLRTGALEKGSAQRFAETAQWALDVTATGGMDVLGPGYRSTLHVRLIHSYVRRHVAAMPDWRTEQWGIPINQTDMAATLVGALIAPSIGAAALGILATPRELDAAIHVTRYVGWLMGVEDQWLPRSFRDGVRVLYHTLMAITNPDETSMRLARPMAREPLAWHYSSFGPVRGRIAWAQHLSLATVFLGPEAMRQLGLFGYMPPWYPAMRLPINLARHLAARVVPGALDKLSRDGRDDQIAFLRTLTGRDGAAIGASAHASHAA